ncbi:MAG: hypothetical protein QM490_06310 [Candidatus Gracilibacteria bacterium]
MNKETNISIKIGNKFYHILKINIHESDFYIHLITRDRELHRTSDENNDIVYEKLPDHISYHADGVIHITHKKGGGRTTLPFALKENLLNTKSFLDLPVYAISYYEQGFEGLKKYAIEYNEKPEGHVIYEPKGISFTTIMFIKDFHDDLHNFGRNLDFVIKVGGLEQGLKLPKGLIQEEEISYPIVNMNFNPTNEELENLKLFSKQEMDKCESIKPEDLFGDSIINC